MQEGRIALHFHFRHRALFQLSPRFASRLTDTAPQEFAEIRVVAYHHDGFLFSVFFEQFAKVREGRTGPLPTSDAV